MKFLAVFVTLAAVAFGFPETTTWTLNELSNALQSPGTDPVLIPYLEAALNQMMNALHHGQVMESITIAMPIVGEYTVNDLAEALQNPATDPAHIPYLEAALNQMMDAFHAGQDKPTISVVLPVPLPGTVDEPGFIDVWPVQTPDEEPGFIDVWPVQTPDEEPGFIDVWPIQVPDVAPQPTGPTLPPQPVSPPASSSPLVQIIVNVQSQQDLEVPAAPGGVIERPMPVPVPIDALPGWGNFIENH